MEQRQLIETTKEIIEKNKSIGLETHLFFEEPSHIDFEDILGQNNPIATITNLVKIRSGIYCWKGNRMSKPYRTAIFLGEGGTKGSFEFAKSEEYQEMLKNHSKVIQYIKERYFGETGYNFYPQE